jgi:hypothetical protein
MLVIVSLATSGSALAQNTTGVVTNGNLMIQGDNQGNEIAIRATDTAGSFVVEALDGGLINGIPGFVEFDGVTGDINVDLGEGSNQLILTARNLAQSANEAFNIADDLLINTGSGDDSIVVDNVFVGNDVGIVTRGGDDAVTLNAVDVDDELLIRTGSGNDAVNSLTNSFVGGRARILGGAGSDCFLLALTELDAATSLLGNRGNDLLAMALSTFNADLLLDGGLNFDEVFDAGDNTFNGNVVERRIEAEFDGTITDIVNIFRAKPSFVTNTILLSTQGTLAPIVP